MSGFVMGLDPTQVDTAAKFKLGSRGVDHLGNEYVYVKASAAVAQYAGALISEDGTVAEVTTTTAAGGTGQGKRVCVPQVAIGSGSFGWGAIYGGGGTLKAKGAASCVKYTQLHTTATPGVFDDAVVNAGKVIGLVFEATLTGAAAEFASLSYPVTALDTNGA